MKTAELEGVLLDYWAMRALGYERAGDLPLGITGCFPDGKPMPWNPSQVWAQAGPIIEREKIMAAWNGDHWVAGVAVDVERPDGKVSKGAEALVAVVRAFVVSKFGDEVEAGTEIRNG